MTISLKEEEDWARKYSVPSSSPQDNSISLWNYPIGKTDLSQEHSDALMGFLAEDLIKVTLAGSTDTVLFVRGHASGTGEKRYNEVLARDRASKVASFVASRGFPRSQLRTEWVGSREPKYPETSGLAASQNRRVDVVRFKPTVRTARALPPVEGDYAAPQSESILRKGALPSSFFVEIPLEFSLPKLSNAYIVTATKIGGVLKLKIDNGGKGWGAGLVVQDNSGGIKLSAKFEAKIRDDLKGKISFSPASPGNPAVLKVGVEKKLKALALTAGFQVKSTFLYAEYSFEVFQLPDIYIDSIIVSGSWKVVLKLEAGPGPAVIARLAPAGIAAGTVTGTALGTAMLVIGLAKAVEYAKDESIRFTQLLSRRFGVAARVAYEILREAAEVEFRGVRMDWYRTLDSMGPFFDHGVESVESLLRDGDKEEYRNSWGAKYGDASQSFSAILNNVLTAVGKYDNSDSDYTEDPVMRL